MFLVKILLRTGAGLFVQNYLFPGPNTWGGWEAACSKAVGNLQKEYGPLMQKEYGPLNIHEIQISYTPMENTEGISLKS